MFITEKVLKLFNNGQGLILFSQPGFLQKVKQLGYHTLGEEFGINEDYDDVEDNEERMKRVLAETVKICNQIQKSYMNVGCPQIQSYRKSKKNIS